MKAVLLWTINHFPTSGMLSGPSTHEILACLYVCTNQKLSGQGRVGKHLHLIVIAVVYRCTIHGKVDMSEAPERLTVDQLQLHVSQLPKVVENSSFEIEGFGEQHNWTKRSRFWDLPYWKTICRIIIFLSCTFRKKKI